MGDKQQQPAPSQPGIYEPLDPGSIRILYLQAATSLQAPLSGELHDVQLHDEHAYEALSYAWGGAFLRDSLPSGEIYLEAHAISITGNLRDALRRLRGREISRALWVDAICINQDDSAERSAQVAIMAQIYSMAVQVIMWLGEDSPQGDGQHFFDCCRRHSKVINSRWARTWRTVVYDIIQWVYSFEFAHDILYIRRLYDTQPLLTWRPVRAWSLSLDFCGRRYLTRRWCIQEVVMAKQTLVMCGAHSMTGADLHNIAKVKRTPRNGKDHLRPAWWRNTLDDPFRIQESCFDPLETLTECSGHDCADPRDRIYALASILKAHPQCPNIHVDYDLPWTTVYAHFTRDYIMMNGFLATWRVLLLAAGQHSSYYKRNPELPSWVPDWRHTLHDPCDNYKGQDLPGALSAQSTRAALDGLVADCDDKAIRILLTYYGTIQQQISRYPDNEITTYQLSRDRYYEDDCLYGIKPKYHVHGTRGFHLVLRPCAGGGATFSVVGDIMHSLKGPPTTVPIDEHEIVIL